MTGKANSVIVALAAIVVGVLAFTTDVVWWKLALGGLVVAVVVGLIVDRVKARPRV